MGGTIPKKGYKAITVPEHLYEELEQLKETLRADSLQEVIYKLLRGAKTNKDIKDVLECEARRAGRNAYMIMCKNGSRAIVPESSIAKLVEASGISIWFAD